MIADPSRFVATLVARKGSADIDRALLKSLRAALGTNEAPVWLDPGLALDQPFSVPTDALAALRVEIATLIDGRPIDAVIQCAEGRRKALFLADMDSTMIGQECIDELADYAGLREHVAAITERAMQGEIEFEPALRERVALLKGLPLSVIDDVLSGRITLTPGAQTLVRTLRANGVYCALVSGGFTLFTGPISGRLGFDEHWANTLVVEGDKLTGRVAEPILGRQAKLDRLIKLRTGLKLEVNATMAVGDGANDLPMLAEAGLGVAFRAKPAVAAATQARIDHNDLEALLYLQGYSRAEFRYS